MPKHVLIIACACLLTVQTGATLACEGIVVEVTLDAIKIEQWGKTYTFLVINDLQTNTDTWLNSGPFSVKLKDVKKGDKVAVKYYIKDGDWICTGIRPWPPDDAGMVAEVGKDTITIRNDKGETTFYRVKKDLADNSRDHHSPLYPSRFSEVTAGAGSKSPVTSRTARWCSVSWM